MRKSKLNFSLTLLLLLISGALLVTCKTKVASAQSSEKPNIIFLLTDDQRWDALGFAGNEVIQTPQMDRLAQEGVYFQNAYVTTSICAVSRASILSGQYARRHGIQDFATSFSAEAFAKTYPALLRQLGYYTGFIGKYGVGREMPADQFDEWYGFPGQGTYHHEDDKGNYQHLTSLIGDQAEAFIQQADKQKPFCLSISFKAPHVEGLNDFIPDPNLNELYAEDVIPVPVTAGDEYFEAFPDFFKAGNEGRSRWQVRFSTSELYQENVKKYYRLVSGVDKVVGRIREQLAASGLDQNTVIIFTSDNGFYLGEHGLAGKWYGHEESIRVPMILYDPRLPEEQKRQVRKEIALNIDVAPTILSLAGQQAPETMQGMDLTRLIDKPASDWRQDFFYEHLYSHDGKIPQTEGVVGERYKYLRYLEPNPDYEVLYDDQEDPDEIENLADDPAYQDVLKKMRDRYKELKENAK
jgi:arylsulfatase A-like enzyme